MKELKENTLNKILNQLPEPATPTQFKEMVSNAKKYAIESNIDFDSDDCLYNSFPDVTETNVTPHSNYYKYKAVIKEIKNSELRHKAVKEAEEILIFDCQDMVFKTIGESNRNLFENIKTGFNVDDAKALELLLTIRKPL